VKDHLFGWAIRGRRSFCTQRACWRRPSVAGASAQAGAPAVARHDAASGRLDACVACGPVGAGSGRHDGRCDERHSVGVSGARRGHCLDVPGAGGGIWPAWSAAELLYRSGSHYFHTPEAGGRSTARADASGRALEHLGVEHIAAYSPQRGAGRSASSIRCRTVW